MAIKDGEELVVVDFTESSPEVCFAKEAEVSEQLTESHTR
jgi:hypothetical protein